MAEAFSPNPKLSGTDALGGSQNRRVLVTGAGGRIGSYFVQHSHQKYDLRLMVHSMNEKAEGLRQFGEVVTAELTNLPRIKEICSGMDTVVHLAARADPSTQWDDLLETNIIGTYNVFIAAKAVGCRRVIFASSIHAVSGYPADVQVKTSEAVNPGDLYGVSKCFGEALGRYMAEQESLSTIALRIGAFQPLETARSEKGLWMLDAWVSQRDLNQLINLCIDDETIRFAIFHGLSDNRFKRLDISDARERIGYAPVDDSTEEIPSVKELHLKQRVPAHNLADKSQNSGIQEEL